MITSRRGFKYINYILRMDDKASILYRSVIRRFLFRQKENQVIGNTRNLSSHNLEYDRVSLIFTDTGQASGYS